LSPSTISTDIHLRQEEAKLVFLAVAYHLGRPGSELDPLTKQTVEHGLAEVAAELQPQLKANEATINLRAPQAKRLLSGMAGTISELKTYPMLQLRDDGSGAPRRSSVPGFDRSLQHLFPELEEDLELTLDIAEQMLMLRRRIGEETAHLEEEAPPEPPKRKGIWPFGRKG
jgi:hypothetical protein